MNRSATKQSKSRQATAAVMVLALGAAIYLNWSFAREAPQDVTAGQTQAAVETAADAAPVLDPLEAQTAAAAQSGEGEPAANKNYGEAQLVSVSQDTGAEFFEQARLSRSKARDEALEALNDALKDTNVSEEEQKALTTRLSAQVKTSRWRPSWKR